MAKTIFEEMGGKYERQGDYLIPCLTVSAEEEQPIGIWGQRHLDYLKHHCKVTYTNLLTSGRLNAYESKAFFGNYSEAKGWAASPYKCNGQ